jgi:hypothetical protein
LSSILDALKKAEQESTTERGAGTPWPAPLPAQSPSRQRTRRWWVPLGIVFGLCIFGVVFWQIRQPDITPPVDSMTATGPLLSPKPNHAAPFSLSEAPKPTTPVAQGHQLRLSSSTDHSPASMAGAPSVQSEKKSLPSVAPAEAPRVQSSPTPKEKNLRQTVFPTSGSTIAPADDPNRHPADSAKSTGQPTSGFPDIAEVFKSDPRIDLQALVWAPEAAARFVVINNRLIKEGGSMDNIVVVRINPDDVLLAEGSDRWHEAFRIR